MTRFAWILNLDADLELAAGAGYAPSTAVHRAMAPHVARLAKLLLGPADVMLVEGRALGGSNAVLDAAGGTLGGPNAVLDAAGRALGGPNAVLDAAGRALGGSNDMLAAAGRALGGGFVGRAFCPTPRALALLRSAGVEPEAHPPFEVLRRVNGRAFSAELGQTLPGAVFARSLEEACAALAAPPPVGRQWRAKRAFGMAGRGQRPIAPGAPSAADAQFLAASLARDGGIQIEPEVELVRELAVHGLLAPSGAFRLGRLVEQRCDASGQWLESLPSNEEHPALFAEAGRVATALHEAGYFGPFGLDAFELRAADGSVILNPRSEINARYSMGFAASGLTKT